MKRIESKQMNIDILTKTDLSSFFEIAIIPVTQEEIVARTRKKTVTSHHLSSKDSTPRNLTRNIERRIMVRKIMLRQTDHFPRFEEG